jgi:hypothetical protein
MAMTGIQSNGESLEAKVSDTTCCPSSHDEQAYCLTRRMVMGTQMSANYYLQWCELLVNTGNSTHAPPQKRNNK